MKRFFILVVLTAVWASWLPAAAANPTVSNGVGLYPFTRRNVEMQPGQTVSLRVLDNADRVPGNFGWLTWSGETGSDQLVASLQPPGNAPTTYFNPGTPSNGWTPDYSDSNIDVGDWVQGMPGQINADEVRAALDLHIANKEVMVIPLYDAVSGGGSQSYYRVASFAAFQLLSYDFSGQDPSMTGKFLRWVVNGDWTH